MDGTWKCKLTSMPSSTENTTFNHGNGTILKLETSALFIALWVNANAIN
jgi:hypothetical protein